MSIRRALAVAVPVLIAAIVWIGGVQPRTSPAASAIANSRFGHRHPALVQDLLTRPGVGATIVHGVELEQTTHIYTGPWLGVPRNFPANGKTVVLYTLSWRRRGGTAHLQLYVVLGPRDQVLQTQLSGSPPPS